MRALKLKMSTLKVGSKELKDEKKAIRNAEQRAQSQEKADAKREAKMRAAGKIAKVLRELDTVKAKEKAEAQDVKGMKQEVEDAKDEAAKDRRKARAGIKAAERIKETKLDAKAAIRAAKSQAANAEDQLSSAQSMQSAKTKEIVTKKVSHAKNRAERQVARAT